MMRTEATSAGLETRENRLFASEIKFSVLPDVAPRIRAWAREHLAADPYASGPEGDEYRVTSLYLDNENLDVLYRRRSFARAKFRVRRYDAGSMVFLERKMRTTRLLAKRRTGIALPDLARLDDGVDHAWQGRWFHERILHRQLRPVCQVAYDRFARIGWSPYGAIRLTLDDGLHVNRAEGLAFVDAAGAPVLRDRLILELKYRVALPSIFKRLIEEFGLRPERRSKYRLGMDALGESLVQIPGIDAPCTASLSLA